MTTLVERTFRPVQPLPQPPEWFVGSWPEYLVWAELEDQGYVDGVDFTYQSGLFGGRLNLGGLIIDFLFNRPAGLAINVNGRYFHYNRPGTVQPGRDAYAKAQMASLGYTLVFIDDFAVLQDTAYYVTQALAFQDFSEFR